MIFESWKMTPLDQLSQMRLHFFHERPKKPISVCISYVTIQKQNGLDIQFWGLLSFFTIEQWNNGPIKNNWSDIGKFVNMSHFVKIDIKGIFLKFHNFLIS